MFQPGGPTLKELTKQALSSTEDGYDQLASKFDKTPFRTPDSLLQQVAPHIERAGPHLRGLDLCCGTGAGLAMLRPLCTHEVVGVDMSSGMLDIARRNLDSVPGDAKVRLLQHNVLTWNPDVQFDVAVCFGAFGHITPEQEPALLDLVYKALRPGGRFVFITGRNPGPKHLGWWAAKGFNATMRVRNALIKPEFIMYYLTFLVPEVVEKLEERGFDVSVLSGVFDRPFDGALMVEAVKPIE
jgi:SAM-dependent methyltransferase